MNGSGVGRTALRGGGPGRVVGWVVEAVGPAAMRAGKRTASQRLSKVGSPVGGRAGKRSQACGFSGPAQADAVAAPGAPCVNEVSPADSCVAATARSRA